MIGAAFSQFHFFLLILVFQVVNLINLRLCCYIESLDIDIVSNQNDFMKHIHNTVKVPCK